MPKKYSKEYYETMRNKLFIVRVKITLLSNILTPRRVRAGIGRGDREPNIKTVLTLSIT